MALVTTPVSAPGIPRYLLMSLLLHASLVLPALIFQSKLPPPASDKLVMELFGMLSEEQHEARQAVLERPKQRPTRASDSAKRWTTTQSESPVQQVTKEQTNQSPQVEPEIAATQAKDAQAQQRIRDENWESAEIKRYMAKVTKKLQSNASYPAEAKSRAHEGAPVVRFVITATGAIQTGSLKILQSSGFSILDAQALKAAEASAPFEPPLHEVDIAIPVSFWAR